VKTFVWRIASNNTIPVYSCTIPTDPLIKRTKRPGNGEGEKGKEGGKGKL